MSSLATSLERARARVESKLLDPSDPLTTVTITAAATFATREFDTDTGTWASAVSSSVIYTGPGLLRRADTLGGDNEQGGEPVVVARWKLKLPLGTSGILEGQIITAVTGRDSQVVGRTFRITEVQAGSFKMLMTCMCEEIRQTIIGRETSG